MIASCLLLQLTTILQKITIAEKLRNITIAPTMRLRTAFSFQENLRDPTNDNGPRGGKILLTIAEEIALHKTKKKKNSYVQLRMRAALDHPVTSNQNLIENHPQICYTRSLTIIYTSVNSRYKSISIFASPILKFASHLIDRNQIKQCMGGHGDHVA